MPFLAGGTTLLAAARTEQQTQRNLTGIFGAPKMVKTMPKMALKTNGNHEIHQCGHDGNPGWLTRACRCESGRRIMKQGCMRAIAGSLWLVLVPWLAAQNINGSISGTCKKMRIDKHRA